MPDETLKVVDGELKVVPATPRTDTIVLGGQTITVERTALEVSTTSWVPAEVLVDKTPESAKKDQWVDIISTETNVYDDNREVTGTRPRTAEELADAQAEYDDLPEQWVNYSDQWYTGRDYNLFSSLIPGLRGDSDNAEFEERGWPEDAHPVNQEYMEGWGYDGHSHSWLTLAELETVDWSKKLEWEYVNPVDNKPTKGNNDPWIDMIDRMCELADEKCYGDRTAVRIVFFFDN